MYPVATAPGTGAEVKTAPVKDGSRRSPDSTHAIRGSPVVPFDRRVAATAGRSSPRKSRTAVKSVMTESPASPAVTERRPGRCVRMRRTETE